MQFPAKIFSVYADLQKWKYKQENIKNLRFKTS